MLSSVTINGKCYPRLKVSGCDRLPPLLNRNDRLLLTGELCYCATQRGSAVGNGLYYNVEIQLDASELAELQGMMLDTGHRIDPDCFDAEKPSIRIKKRAITYNKPVPPIRIYREGGGEQPLAIGSELEPGFRARVAATITPFEREGERLFDLTLGVIQLLDSPLLAQLKDFQYNPC